MPNRNDRDDSGFDRDILDIIPQRFDSDPDSRQARKSAMARLVLPVALGLLALSALGVTARHIIFGEAPRGEQHLDAPVIRADGKPIKVKPQDPGGMDVPNQDKLIYERMGADGSQKPTERLLPPPEQPQMPPDQPRKPSIRPAFPQPPAPIASAGGGAPTAAIDAPDTTPAPVVAAAMPAAKAIPPVQSPVQSPVQPPVQPPAKEPPVPAAVAPAPVKVSAPHAAPAPAMAPPAAKAVAGGAWLVQLGALRSEEDAKTEWTHARALHKDLLGALSSDIVRVDLGAKGIFWRLRAGPLDEAQARTLCAELKKQNQGCIGVRK